MRASHFRTNNKKNSRFFHFNFQYTTTGYFRELDWIHIQKTTYTFACLFKVEIQALVMMDTHVHLLFEIGDQNENFFCSSLERALNVQPDLSGFCEPILSKAQYLNTYKYIYNNPVVAGLCEKPQDYPYSSLKLILGTAPNYCLIADNMGLIHNPHKVLTWLNDPEPAPFSDFNSHLNLQRSLFEKTSAN